MSSSATSRLAFENHVVNSVIISSLGTLKTDALHSVSVTYHEI